jgi:RND family efflux transporter MFP subunit
MSQEAVSADTVHRMGCQRNIYLCNGSLKFVRLKVEGTLVTMMRQSGNRAPAGALQQRFLAKSVLIAALVATIAGCSTSRAPSAGSPEQVTGVSVAVARSTVVTDSIEVIGTIRASQTAEIASQTAGNVLEIRVHEGDRVRAGQLLAVIDDAQPRAAVDQATAAQASANEAVNAAESDYALAAATQARYEQLYEKKEISAQQFDQMKTRTQSTQAQRDLARAELSRETAAVGQARVSLSYCRVEAPFAGLVTQRLVDTGTFASTGMRLFALEDTGRYRLEALLNESDMQSIHIGAQATVVIDAFGATELSGKVVQIVPSADPASRSLLIKIELQADPRLRSGLFGRARFSRGTRTALTIPRGAVIERGQMRAVYVLDAGNIATLRYVTTGSALGQQVEVLSGLESGERVAVAPGDRELAGKRIEPRP